LIVTVAITCEIALTVVLVIALRNVFVY
jgi:hypothetical protein